MPKFGSETRHLLSWKGRSLASWLLGGDQIGDNFSVLFDAEKVAPKLAVGERPARGPTSLPLFAQKVAAKVAVRGRPWQRPLFISGMFLLSTVTRIRTTNIRSWLLNLLNFAHLPLKTVNL